MALLLASSAAASEPLRLLSGANSGAARGGGVSNGTELVPACDALMPAPEELGEDRPERGDESEEDAEEAPGPCGPGLDNIPLEAALESLLVVGGSPLTRLVAGKSPPATPASASEIPLVTATAPISTSSRGLHDPSELSPASKAFVSGSSSFHNTPFPDCVFAFAFAMLFGELLCLLDCPETVCLLDCRALSVSGAPLQESTTSTMHASKRTNPRMAQKIIELNRKDKESPSGKKKPDDRNEKLGFPVVVVVVSVAVVVVVVEAAAVTKTSTVCRTSA